MKLLHKYMSSPNYLLDDGYIRATQLAALNDPFEASYCQNSLSELSSYFELCDTGDVLLNYVEDNKYKVGVISFSEAKDNLLMWAHYANEHKGAVVGIFSEMVGHSIFESLFELKINLTASSLFEGFNIFKGQCLPVIYRKQPRYRVDMFDFDYSNIFEEGVDRILFEIFQQKSDEWIYEKEHRITLRLEQADKVEVVDIGNIENKIVLQKIVSSDFCLLEHRDGSDVHVVYLNQITDPIERECYASALASLAKNPQNIYLFKLCRNAIQSIILGRRADADTVNQAVNYPRKTNHFQLLKATLNESFYTLQFEEVSRS